MPGVSGRPRSIPEVDGSTPVTSESLGLGEGVASNSSSLPSRLDSSKSLPDSGCKASMTLEGLRSKSLLSSSSSWIPSGGLSTRISPEEPSGAGCWRVPVSIVSCDSGDSPTNDTSESLG
ncbi:hypothetical protein BH23PLA1_BH23PLA1_08520 [soil metagenome]